MTNPKDEVRLLLGKGAVEDRFYLEQAGGLPYFHEHVKKPERQ
jgi:hypothetical protein